MHTLACSNQRSKHHTPIALASVNLSPATSASHGPLPRRVMRERTVLGVAGVALLAACTTPIASTDYAADKKKYDECVTRERDRNAGSVASTYIEASIRNFCGEPPTPPRNDKK